MKFRGNANFPRQPYFSARGFFFVFFVGFVNINNELATWKRLTRKIQRWLWKFLNFSNSHTIKLRFDTLLKCFNSHNAGRVKKIPYLCIMIDVSTSTKIVFLLMIRCNGEWKKERCGLPYKHGNFRDGFSGRQNGNC